MNRKQASQAEHHRPQKSQPLFFALITTVALVLLALIWTGSQQAGLVVLAVTIVLTVLILAITGSPELLPATLRAFLSEIRRILRG
jgi:asparagine N-glycosylation enzyme membrane subunit Stt3